MRNHRKEEYKSFGLKYNIKQLDIEDSDLVYKRIITYGESGKKVVLKEV